MKRCPSDLYRPGKGTHAAARCVGVPCQTILPGSCSGRDGIRPSCFELQELEAGLFLCRPTVAVHQLCVAQMSHLSCCLPFLEYLFLHQCLFHPSSSLRIPLLRLISSMLPLVPLMLILLLFMLCLILIVLARLSLSIGLRIRIMSHHGLKG